MPYSAALLADSLGGALKPEARLKVTVLGDFKRSSNPAGRSFSPPRRPRLSWRTWRSRPSGPAGSNGSSAVTGAPLDGGPGPVPDAGPPIRRTRAAQGGSRDSPHQTAGARSAQPSTAMALPRSERWVRRWTPSRRAARARPPPTRFSIDTSASMTSATSAAEHVARESRPDHQAGTVRTRLNRAAVVGAARPLQHPRTSRRVGSSRHSVADAVSQR
jgi:hypothetical protein